MQGILHSLKHLALIALILRAMLPAGWMPAATGTFTICTVQSAHQQDPANKVPDESGQHDKLCAFSGTPQLAATPDAPALLLPAFHAFAASTDRASAAASSRQTIPRNLPAHPR